MNRITKAKNLLASGGENKPLLPAVSSDAWIMNGKSLLDDLKCGAWNIDHVAGYGSRSLVRAAFIKQSTLVLLNYIKRTGGNTTYKRRAKAALNAAGFYHLSELARKMKVNKQTVDAWVEKLDAVYVIELDGRGFYRWSNGR